LAAELSRPGAPSVQIALALEGLGRVALPVLDDLYSHKSDSVSFHAATAGLRLGDHVACDTMILHAEDRACEFRFQAIHALARARDLGAAGIALRRLLNDEDPRVQVAAYEGLLLRGDSRVASVSVGGDNFHLDQIASDRPNFIYVKRAGSRRIALFGRDLRAQPPLLYRAPDGSLTISAEAEDDELTVMRVVVSSGSMAPPVTVSPELAELIDLLGQDADVGEEGEVVGLSVDYGGVARALYHLCADKAINATFILEQPNATELFGPAARTGRPESEL
jgi:hypothetical protein